MRRSRIHGQGAGDSFRKPKPLRSPAAGLLRPGWILAGWLMAAAVVVPAAYWSALSAQAISFDDNEYLVNNELVKNPSWAHAWQFISEVWEPSTVHGYYQPLTMISLMVDYALGGRVDDLAAFHRTSLILHMLNTLLVIILFYQLFRNAWAAGMVGLLFGVHPMWVETIAWVGERKTLLAAFFVLLSLVFYIRYARAGSRWEYGLSLLWFVLALMSKPTSTPLPVGMLLLDIWPLKRFNRRAVLEKIPFLLIAGVSAVITYESQRRTAIAVTPSQTGAAHIFYVLTHNIIFYLRNLAWPVNLSSHYPYPRPLNLENVNVIIGVVGTVVLIPALLISLRWTRSLLVGWSYFFVMIFPTMGVITFTNVIAADKFAYLPVFGLLLPLVYGLSKLWRWCREKNTFWPRTASVGIVGILSVLLSTGSHAYLDHWRTSESLFRYMISFAPQSPTLTFHLAYEFAQQGRRDEAIEYYRRTVEIYPQYAKAHNNLGTLLAEEGKLDEAIRHYKLALKNDPEHALAHNNLGNALLNKGKLDEAHKHLELAVHYNPQYAEAHYNLANLYVRQEKWEPAVKQYRLALKLDPQLAAAYKNLASAYMRQGNLPKAVKAYEQALRLEPKYVDAANFLALTYATRGDANIRDVKKAVKLGEWVNRATGWESPLYMGTLSVCYAEAGQLQDARRIGEKAVQLAHAQGNQSLAAKLRQQLKNYSASASQEKQKPR